MMENVARQRIGGSKAGAKMNSTTKNHSHTGWARRLPLLACLLIFVNCSSSDEKPVVSVLQKTLEDAGAAQERYAETHNDRHARTVAQLEAEGLEIPDGIEMTIPAVNDRSRFAREYCVEATDDEGNVAHFDNILKYSEGPCGSFWFNSPSPESSSDS